MTSYDSLIKQKLITTKLDTGLTSLYIKCKKKLFKNSSSLTRFFFDGHIDIHRDNGMTIEKN